VLSWSPPCAQESSTGRVEIPPESLLLETRHPGQVSEAASARGNFPINGQATDGFVHAMRDAWLDVRK
jgi:hypothetical protein